MKSLAVRVKEMCSDLKELNGALEGDMKGCEAALERSELLADVAALRSFKEVVDQSRHLVWHYMLAAEQEAGADLHYTFQTFRMDRVRRMLDGIQSDPIPEATELFFAEINRRTGGLSQSAKA